MILKMKIGLLSDTHGYLDEPIFRHLTDCDELWHAGDIGDTTVADQLSAFKPLQAVYGNIDGQQIRLMYAEDLWLEREGLSIWITHIGGYPPRYNPRVKQILSQKQPHIFVCGHSHILKVMRDPKRKNMLCLNPGAAGKQGFHKIRTMLKFELHQQRVMNMQVIELGKRAVLPSE